MDIIDKHLRESIIAFGVLLGTLIQYLILSKDRKNKLRFAVFLALSSIFTALYVVKPALNFFGVCDKEWADAMYALSSIISLNIVSFIVTILPKALQKRVLNMIGAEDEDN